MVKSLGGSRQIPNMRGKRHHPLRCRCCVVMDLRPKFTAIEHQKEMDAAMSTETLIGADSGLNVRESWGGLG